MGDDTWGFRAVEGDVTVEDGVVRIESKPGSRIAREVSRSTGGTLSGLPRVGATVLGVAVLLSALALFAYRVANAESGLIPAFFVVLGLVQVVHGVWQLSRDATIPVEEIEAATLDTDRRKLVFDTGEDDRRFASLRFDDGNTTLRLPTDEAVRDARETLELKGIDLAVEEDVETVYRVETREGAAFCEDCGRQVSPADAVCPACGYALRVEADSRSEEREWSFERSTTR